MEWSQTYPGLLSMVPAVRAFVRAMLEDSPAQYDATLVAAELATNALRHSGVDRGEIKVTVTIDPGRVRIAVTDRGVGNWTPPPGMPDDSEESGRGLRIVAELADKFGHDRDPASQTVWAELTWPAEAP